MAEVDDGSDLTLEQQQALAMAAARARAAGNLPPVAPPKPSMGDQMFGKGSTLGSIYDTFIDTTTGIGQGATFGLGDEINAGIAAPFRAGYDYATGKGFDLGDAYDRELQHQRDI